MQHRLRLVFQFRQASEREDRKTGQEGRQEAYSNIQSEQQGFLAVLNKESNAAVKQSCYYSEISARLKWQRHGDVILSVLFGPFVMLVSMTKSHHVSRAQSITLISYAWQTFSYTFDENFSDEFLPHLEDDTQITSCDFESLCYWTFTYNNTHSDWSVVSPQQLKGTRDRTMPEIDHSLGRSDGHFLLLSPSDAEKCEHQIISPVLPGSNRQCILQVALYESGPTLGNLTVLIKPLLSDLIVHSEVLNQRRPDTHSKMKVNNAQIQTMKGDIPPERARNEWQVYKAVIGQMDEPIQVTLLYTSCGGEGEVTVALDSLDFIDCGSGDEAMDLNPMCGKSFHCVNSDVCIEQSQVCNFHTDCPLGEDEGLICDALPFGSYCSFESDSCGWSGSSQHSGWRRVAGDELLQKQNMQGVTLQRTPGHFLYLQVRESSSFKEASFQSSFFPPPISTSACQMRFSLYLYGSFNGSLQVAIEENGTGHSSLIWERQGQSTDDWEAVALEVTDLNHGFHVHIKAAWGRNSNADLAFDNIAIGAACFKTDLNSLQQIDFDFLSPLPEPSVTGTCRKDLGQMEGGELVPLLIAAGGGGNAYLEDPESSLDPMPPEQFENSTAARGTNGQTGAAGGGGGWKDGPSLHQSAGRSLVEGAVGGTSCPLALSKLSWSTYGGFGGGGGACTAGGGGGGYRGGDAALTDDITADGQNGVSFIHPMGEIFLQPLAAMEGHGECEIKVELNCSHCRTQSCKREEDSHLVLCLCDDDEFLANDNVTCVSAAAPPSPVPPGQLSTSLILAVVASIVVSGVALVCAGVILSKRLLQLCAQAVPSSFHRLLMVSLHLSSPPCREVVCALGALPPPLPPPPPPPILPFPPHFASFPSLPPPLLPSPQHLHRAMARRLLLPRTPLPLPGRLPSCIGDVGCPSTAAWHRRKNDLHAVRRRLQSPEYKLSKIRSSTIMTDYNPNYCFAGKAASLSDLKEVPRKNITLLRALGHGAFGEVYEGQILGMSADGSPMQVAIKTLPEICSEQDEMDFLMEALIMSKFSHLNIVRCVGVSLNILPRFILLELMTGGDMKSFLRQNRPRAGQTFSLTMRDLLQMARDIACGCRYLEENQFIHRSRLMIS
ncbi:hypothetical protein CCH79_00004382 [Gambusia affinis]|uniref:Protein kinase domain-containing protein n=1 Tax=Gambusia affinis TaxID=33528 RepID=A0A315UZP6_GAMAF|nr:hypothetical protein CCH79_00004382 [Gambusia affinis]